MTSPNLDGQNSERPKSRTAKILNGPNYERREPQILVLFVAIFGNFHRKYSPEGEEVIGSLGQEVVGQEVVWQQVVGQWDCYRNNCNIVMQHFCMVMY